MLGFGDDPGEQAAEASIQGANITAQAQREGLDYLKEREEIPRQFSEQGLKGLGGLYGMEGGTGSQQDLINKALQSPLYGALMGGKEAGEEAILRNASATGGLRSGNVQSAMYDYNTQLQNKALLESYNQQLSGLQGLAGLPSYAPQIAQQTGAIGQTLGQGQVAAGQALQTGQQQQFGSLMGLGQLGLGAAYMFSDRRLKKNIKRIGEVKGIPWYRFTWNKIAEQLGLSGECQGTMAEIANDLIPESVVMKDGFMMVNYTKLGIFDKRLIS